MRCKHSLLKYSSSIFIGAAEQTVKALASEKRNRGLAAARLLNTPVDRDTTQIWQTASSFYFLLPILPSLPVKCTPLSLLNSFPPTHSHSFRLGLVLSHVHSDTKIVQKDEFIAFVNWPKLSTIQVSFNHISSIT